MTQKSCWSVLYSDPHHGTFIKKLERLGDFSVLDMEEERFIFNHEKIVHASFMVEHATDSWDGLVMHMLTLARKFTPVWKIAIGDEMLSGETGPECSGMEQYRVEAVKGLRLLRWEINAAQEYRRTSWLGGLPNHW
ncbi:MAG: hypothetical protein FWD77_05025 [Betaproteobacteria bacterium]|nr:hypothetical protein [Betaproteobacteria bacterium]